MGPAAATCVGGKWSPSTLPRCIRKRHPRILYLFRGKRDLTSQQGNGLTSDEGSVRVTSQHQRQQELTSLVDQHLKVVTEHDWDEDKGTHNTKQNKEISGVYFSTSTWESFYFLCGVYIRMLLSQRVFNGEVCMES